MSQFWCPSLVKCNLESKSSTDIDHSPKRSFLACMCAKPLQSFLILYNPMDYSLPAPLSMGFSRQEYWSGLPFPSPGDLPKPGTDPGSSALQANTLDKNYFTSLKSIISSNQLFSCECLAYFEFLAVSRNVIETGRHMKKIWKGD